MSGFPFSQGAKMLAHHTTTEPKKFPPRSRRRQLAETPIHTRNNAPMNVKFKYMYRDASNYKQHGDAVFRDSDFLPLEEIEQQIRAYLQDGEYFIARQVHIEERFFDALHDDDHPWHEFSGVENTTQLPFDPDHANRTGCFRDIREFLADLESAHRAGWDETQVRPDLATLQERQKQNLKAALISEPSGGKSDG
jgi:hypothetical protein